MEQTAGGAYGLPHVLVVAVAVDLGVALVEGLGQTVPEKFIGFSAGNGKIRGTAHIPGQHLFQHGAGLGVVGGHGERELIPGNALGHIAQAPEKLVAAALKLAGGGRLDMKVLIAGRRKLRKAADLVQQRQKELVSGAALLHVLYRLHAQVDPVSVLQQKKPGIELLVVGAQAEPVSVSKVAVLFLGQNPWTEEIQPCRVLPERVGFGYYIHKVKVLIHVLWHVWIGAGALQIGRQNPGVGFGHRQDEVHHLLLAAHRIGHLLAVIRCVLPNYSKRRPDRQM